MREGDTPDRDFLTFALEYNSHTAEKKLLCIELYLAGDREVCSNCIVGFDVSTLWRLCLLVISS